MDPEYLHSEDNMHAHGSYLTPFNLNSVHN